MNETQTPKEMRLPMVPLRGTVIFPETAVHFDVGREKSVQAMNTALEGDNRLFVVTQYHPTVDNPGIQDVYMVGTIVRVKQVVRLPDGVFRLLVEGESRAVIVGIYDAGNMQYAQVCTMEDKGNERTREANALMRLSRKYFEKLAGGRKDISPETKQAITGAKTPGMLADLLATYMVNDIHDMQKVLECVDAVVRLDLVVTFMVQDLDVVQLEARVQKRVHDRIEKNNREYYLREQLHVIEDELGESDDDIAAYEKQLAESKIAGEARQRTEKELKRLARMGTNTPESNVIQSYVEYMLELPWGKYDADDINLKRARSVLEADHYGLEDVKKRIIEYLAVRSIKKDSKGPILCLVGAPGVGKTSIARSIARALKRAFCQVSLGGVHDEAEIRGHRRTYIGAMPGRIISAIKQAGTMNPVFLFDEIDKMASDLRGDPASAMLEVLDPEQNSAYRDHYLEAPFDLSKVLFITTANTLSDIPAPLRDRMEIIEVPSYTMEDKVQIAKRHLWKKQLSENALDGKKLKITEAAIRTVIDGYTRESGVRTLERKLGTICRKAVVRMLDIPEEERKPVTVKPQDVVAYLGAVRFTHSEIGKEPETGVVNGLAWTSVGGEVMPIEVGVMPGTGLMELTGSLGDVMKESAKIAWSYVRSKMESAGIDEEFRKKHDIHVHIPEGATPKDGPSAGIAMACAMFSAVTGVKARQDIAMTGEISLRGKALPIGGLKEKLLAAHRAHMKYALIPVENKKDLEELPEEILKELSVQTISSADEAFKWVLGEARGNHVKAVV